MKGKIPLVLFSGGLDSTAMLWKYLQYTPVDVLYADGGQHPLKITKELECRRKTIEYLNRVSPYKVQRDLRTDNNITIAGSPTVKYSQPIAWMIAALSVLDTNRHSELAVGYVGDDGGFLRWLPSMHSTWESMQVLAKTGDTVPVVFPIVDNSKVTLLSSIPTELLDSIWVCERPTVDEKRGIVPCMACTPCIMGQLVLNQYQKLNGHSIYSKRLVQQLRTAESADSDTWKPRSVFTSPRRVAVHFDRDSSGYYRHPKKETDTSPTVNIDTILNQLA